MTALLALLALALIWSAWCLGYHTGYRTRKTEEENRATARAARLRAFTGKGTTDGEWYKVKER